MKKIDEAFAEIKARYKKGSMTKEDLVYVMTEMEVYVNRVVKDRKRSLANYHKNQEKAQETQKKYRETHREEAKENKKIWAGKNPEKEKAIRDAHYKKYRDQILARAKEKRELAKIAKHKAQMEENKRKVDELNGHKPTVLL